LNAFPTLALADLDNVLIRLAIAVVIQRVTDFGRWNAIAPFTSINAALRTDGLTVRDALVCLPSGAFTSAADITFVYLIVAIVILTVTSLDRRIARPPLLIRATRLVTG
tara:strand:+ start:316 stop:642 length:327 start_codon:yes stop_codon:yes gene_type:complete